MEYGNRCVKDGLGLGGGGDMTTGKMGIPVIYR